VGPRRTDSSRAVSGTKLAAQNVRGTPMKDSQIEWLGMPPSEHHPTRLQIEAVQPPRELLPITETGYKSHFVAIEVIEAARPRRLCLGVDRGHRAGASMESPAMHLSRGLVVAARDAARHDGPPPPSAALQE
jgi:hypothetical protein